LDKPPPRCRFTDPRIEKKPIAASSEEDHPICIAIGVKMFALQYRLERITVGVVSKNVGGRRRMGSWKVEWWNGGSVIFAHMILFEINYSYSFSVWFTPEAFTPEFYYDKLKQNMRGKEQR
jgi:hypothetical protein